MARKKRAKGAAREAPATGNKGISTRAALAIGLALLCGLAALSMLRGRGEGQGEPPRPAEPRRPDRGEPHDAPLADDQGAAKARQAASIWAGFDRLPAGEKSKARLTDTLEAAANAIKAAPRASSDRKNLEQQGVEFRKRAAPLASPGARATGESFTVLVPSDDPTRCLEVGQAWSADAANMALLGFRRIECAGPPAKSWELKP